MILLRYSLDTILSRTENPSVSQALALGVQRTRSAKTKPRRRGQRFHGSTAFCTGPPKKQVPRPFFLNRPSLAQTRAHPPCSRAAVRAPPPPPRASSKTAGAMCSPPPPPPPPPTAPLSRPSPSLETTDISSKSCSNSLISRWRTLAKHFQGS